MLLQKDYARRKWKNKTFFSLRLLENKTKNEKKKKKINMKKMHSLELNNEIAVAN